MSDRWIIGEKFNIRILREFSPSEFIGVIHRNSGPNNGTSVERGITGEMIFDMGTGFLLRVLWTRRESDDRGGYLAVAFTGKISEHTLSSPGFRFSEIEGQ